MTAPQFQGVYPPMMTPFTAGGELDIEAFRKNLERWNTEQLGGYVVLGSNSESSYLTQEEKLRLIETTVRHAAPGRPVIAGTGMESTRDTIELTQKAAKLGCHAVLVLTPFYYSERMDDRALISHFTAVADQSPVPVLLYNVPKFTHVTISIPAIAALAKHPNIAGMKDSSGDVPRLAAIQRVVPPTFQTIVGTAGAWFPALTLGIKAGIMALANCLPNECAEVQTLLSRGEMEEAKRLYLRLLPLNTAVTAAYGVAGLKYAASLFGYYSGMVRSPLTALSPDEQSRVNAIVEEFRRAVT